MIGLDTNVVVRFLVQDRPAQSALASQVFADLTPDAPGYLTHVVLVETYWVLTRAYGIAPEEVLATLADLVNSDDITCQGFQDVTRAIIASGDGADFPDALIAETCRSAGCASVVSFDPKAGRLLGFRSP